MTFPLQRQAFQSGPCTTELFVPDAATVKEAYQQGLIPFPYWSQIWPAAKALAQFLAAHSFYVKGKTVVELGAGLGLPSFVAAHTARQVLCTDAIPEAVEVIRYSATHLNLLNLTADVLDWQYLPPELTADVLLLSDINYEPASFDFLQKIISTFLSKGSTVILSTPQRLMAKDFLTPLLADCVAQEEAEVMHEGRAVMTTVLVLKKEG
jgi:predicted nicotinamide N-methyase